MVMLSRHRSSRPVTRCPVVGRTGSRCDTQPLGQRLGRSFRPESAVGEPIQHGVHRLTRLGTCALRIQRPDEQTSRRLVEAIGPQCFGCVHRGLLGLAAREQQLTQSTPRTDVEGAQARALDLGPRCVGPVLTEVPLDQNDCSTVFLDRTRRSPGTVEHACPVARLLELIDVDGQTGLAQHEGLPVTADEPWPRAVVSCRLEDLLEMREVDPEIGRRTLRVEGRPEQLGNLGSSDPSMEHHQREQLPDSVASQPSGLADLGAPT